MEVIATENPRLPRLGVSADSGMLIAMRSLGELERFAQLCLKLRTRALFSTGASADEHSAEDRWTQLALVLLTGRLPSKRPLASGLDVNGLALNRYNGFDSLVGALLALFDELLPSSKLNVCVAIPNLAGSPATAAITFDSAPEIFWVCPGSFVDVRSGKLTVKTPRWCIAGIAA